MTIAILGMIAGLTIPFYQVFQISSQLDNATNELGQSLQRAQEKAMSSQGGQPAGVHLQSGSFTLFLGNSYSPADPANETVALPPTVSLTQGTGVDVIFSRHTGETVNTGVITLTTTSNKFRAISINSLGVVNVQ